ncbi:MAG: hypothetical protein R2748_26915 [Bryobacterales bacterium]
MTRRELYGVIAGGYAAGTLFAQSADGPGPGKGEHIPDFRAVDQNGKPRTFADLTGDNGLLLLFFRSADW